MLHMGGIDTPAGGGGVMDMGLLLPQTDQNRYMFSSRGDLSCTSCCLVSLVSTFYSFPALPPLLQPLH